MKNTSPYITIRPTEKAIMVGVETKIDDYLLPLDDSLRELYLLAQTAGLEIVGETYQRLNRPNPNTYIGSGKVSEVIILVEETDANVVLFDCELSPRHQRELEEKIGYNVKVIDRTALILDIFAQHANTREGRLQVELAQYEYRLPRLTRAWTHLARQSGGASGRTGSVGGVGLRGPGETQLEVDRREISRRISRLKNDIQKVRERRSQHRNRRKNSNIPIITLVGYTNAGKSTLINALTKSDVLAADKLFATLDPTTRRINLPGNNLALISDTVGFIQKLPTQLIAAFQATLEEINESDLLLHVIDISHKNCLAQYKAVQSTLEQINAQNIPVICVLNKIDLLPEQSLAINSIVDFNDSVAVSALTGAGLPELLDTIEKYLYSTLIPIEVILPYNEGNLISLFRSSGQVTKLVNNSDGVNIKGYIPGRLFVQYQDYLVDN